MDEVYDAIVIIELSDDESDSSDSPDSKRNKESDSDDNLEEKSDRLFKCPMCNLVFNNMSILRYHTSLHFNVDLYSDKIIK